MKPRYTDAFWGEHPFDGDMILIKNKNKNKNKISSKLPKSARMAHLTRHTDAHPLSPEPPGAYHVHTGLSNDALPTRAQKLGCLRLGQNRRKIPTALR